MVVAKAKVREMRRERDEELARQRRQAKKQSRKQSAKKRIPNKEIENYVENLLQREMDDLRSSHRKLGSNPSSVSHTPQQALTRKSYQELPVVQNSLRGSFQTSLKQEEASQRNGGFDTTINVSDYGKKQQPSSSVLNQYEAIQQPHTATDAKANDSALLDRLQKSLRVRKNAKTIESGHKHIAMMNNFQDPGSQSKHSY